MPDAKITDLTALTAANAATGDLVEIVDVSDTTMAASGTNKKMTVANLAGAVAKEGVVAADALWDAKGDLAAGTGANTASKLTVGSTGTLLVPDSSTSSGLAWAPFMRPVQSGQYVQAWQGAGNSNQTTTLNELNFTPVYVPQSLTADRIAVNVGIAGSAGAVVRLGIYSPSATTGLPGALVLDAGTVASDSTGFKEITISQALNTGLYWLSVVSQTATCSLRRPGTFIGGFVHWTSDATARETPGVNRYRQTSVSGSLPSNATPTIAGNDFGFYSVWLRAA